MTIKRSSMGIKIGATAIIWGFGTGMLAISIPLVARTESGIILPAMIIVSTTIASVAVWLNTEVKTDN